MIGVIGGVLGSYMFYVKFEKQIHYMNFNKWFENKSPFERNFKGININE